MKNLRLKTVIIAVTSSVLFSGWYTTDDMDRFRAIYIYNYTRYINWKESKGDFVISTCGSDNMFYSLQKIANNKNVGSTKISVNNKSVDSDFGESNIVYISGSLNIADQDKIIKKCQKYDDILLIGESSSKKNAFNIWFFVAKDKLKFHINNNLPEGLQISKSLYEMAD